jgi:5-hydroxytryptamine receptor 2
VGIIGNLLVCLAIGTERRLHNRTNWFLFSLALADMIVSGVVIPLAIVKEFTGNYLIQTISTIQNLSI